MALEPAKLSDFHMAGALGTGTTARVYEAVHTATGQPVAIKVMEHSSPTSEMRERFAREALLLANVESRYVGRILGFGFDKGQPFLVLERLNGETLDAKLRRDGPVPLPIAVRWIEQLIIGVRDCHDVNIIHRDIKPSNIFLHHDGKYARDGTSTSDRESVKLIDFGVARLNEIAGENALTATNHLIGSMGYMAPEQFESAKTVGYPADLYAVGVVIFRALTGRLPFVSRSFEAIVKMKSEHLAPTISSMGIIKNARLDWFVQKAMMRKAEDRFQSAREMLEHWWVVVSSLDQDGATEVSSDMGRVDESYEGVLPRPAGPPATHPYPLSNPQRAVTHPADAEDRTIRRSPRTPPSVSSVVTTPLASKTTSPRPPDSSDRTLREEAGPRTVPYRAQRTDDKTNDETIDETVAMPGTPVRDDVFPDPSEAPTRNDPNLRTLVERELELQKARNRRG